MIDLHEIRSNCCGAWVGQKGYFYTEVGFREPLPKLPGPFYYCQECGKRCEIEEKEEVRNELTKKEGLPPQ